MRRARTASELRNLAVVTAILISAALTLHLTNTALVMRPHVAAAAQVAAVRAPRAFAAPADATLFWLSRRFAPGDPRLVDIVGAGDVMMGSRDQGLDPALRAHADVARLVGHDLAAIFARADIAFANLEGPLYDGDDASAKACAQCFAFRSPTSYAGLLARLGIGVVSLANNHSGDYGAAGRSSTIAALRAHAIAFCGLDQDGARVAELNLRDGTHAAIVSFAPNSGTLDINDSAAEVAIVRMLKRTHAIVLVSFHGGGEGESHQHVVAGHEMFDGEDRGDVVRFAHDAIDAGADIVIGQGPHVPRALEIYRGHLIAYSLGNFWTYGAIDTSAIRGTGPVLETWLAPDGTVAGFAIHSSEQRDTDVPHLDPDGDAERAVLALTASDFPQTAAMLEGAVLAAEQPRS